MFILFKPMTYVAMVDLYNNDKKNTDPEMILQGSEKQDNDSFSCFDSTAALLNVTY